MGDFGKISAANYGQRRAQDAIAEYEAAVAEWLATAGPGSFISRDGGHPYRAAHNKFVLWGGNGSTEDDFEVALARLGYRAGVLAYDGEPRWLLVLPSKATERRTPTPEKRKPMDLDGALAALLDGADAMDAGDLDAALDALAERELA